MLGSQPSNRISIRRSKRGDSDVSSPHHQLKKLRPDRIEKEERKKRKIPQVEYEDEEEESERKSRDIYAKWNQQTSSAVLPSLLAAASPKSQSF